MAQGKRGEDQAPGPVSFRLGDLAPSVQRRARAGESHATVVRRDLDRYYDLLWNTDLPDFTVEEADALTIVLYDSVGLLSARLSGSEVVPTLEKNQRRLRELGSTDAIRPNVPDLKRFAQKLTDMTPLQNLVLLDAVERYWVLYLREPPVPREFFLPLSFDPIHESEVELLQQAGLVHPIYADTYLKAHGLRPAVEPSKRKVLGDVDRKRPQQ